MSRSPRESVIFVRKGARLSSWLQAKKMRKEKSELALSQGSGMKMNRFRTSSYRGDEKDEVAEAVTLVL